MENNKRDKHKLAFMDPLMDWAFKRLFGTEDRKELLISFLNDLFEGEHEISDIFYLDRELQPEYKEGRGCIFDILCEEKSTGKRYLVEIQNNHINNFEDRALYYTCRLITEQKKRGDTWQKPISGVYTICLLNYYLQSSSELRTDLEICNRSTGKRFYDNFKIVLIQLTRLGKIDYFNKNCPDILKWLYLLKNLSNMKEQKFYDQIIENSKAALRKLIDETNVNALSEEEYYAYEAAYRYYDKTIATFETAKQDGWDAGIKEGIKEGRKEGREEGIKEGREEGIKEGIKEGMEKGIRASYIDVAKRMKNMSIPMEMIIKCTNLRKEEIDALQ